MILCTYYNERVSAEKFPVISSVCVEGTVIVTEHCGLTACKHLALGEKRVISKEFGFKINGMIVCGQAAFSNAD